MRGHLRAKNLVLAFYLAKKGTLPARRTRFPIEVYAKYRPHWVALSSCTKSDVIDTAAYFGVTVSAGILLKVRLRGCTSNCLSNVSRQVHHGRLCYNSELSKLTVILGSSEIEVLLTVICEL